MSNKRSEKLKKIGEKIFSGINQIGERFDSEDPLIVVPYSGYAGKNNIFLKGRVLEDERIFSDPSDHKIRNIINNIKRFETDEIPFAKIRITCQQQSFICETDQEGYFVLDSPWNAPQTDQSWLPLEVELLAPTRVDGSTIKAAGEVYILPNTATFGIITDMDDTVLQTHVSSLFKLRMLYNTFFKNAHERLPIEGIIDLLQAFSKGMDGQRQNPVFYLSHSPWNIYDLLKKFITIQQLPKGPLLLRDFGIRPSGSYKDHKTISITKILKTYPHLPFVLLGDAAEHDADFYIDIAKKFPNRIKAIYIRQVRNNKNARRIKQLIEQNTDVNAVLVQSSKEISEHAILNKLIQNLGETDEV